MCRFPKRLSVGLWSSASSGVGCIAAQPAVEREQRGGCRSREHNEKQREREKLQLTLAERERSEALKTAEAQSELEKATRKAQQPPEVVRSIDYNKLVIDRKRRERTAVLYRDRERAAFDRPPELAPPPDAPDVAAGGLRDRRDVARMPLLLETIAPSRRPSMKLMPRK